MAKKPSHYTDAERAAAVALSEKIGIAPAMRRLGMACPDALRRWRAKAGSEQRPRGRYSKMTWGDRAVAVEMADKIGLTAAAHEYRVAPQTIIGWRKHLNGQIVGGVVLDPDPDTAPALPTLLERIIAKRWPGRCLRVCTDATVRPAGHYLIPRGCELPPGAALVSRFALHGIGGYHAAYMDGELSAKAARLPLHPAALVPLADAVGGPRCAEDCLTSLVYMLAGQNLVDGARRMGYRALRGLELCGFLAHAKNDQRQIAAIAALCARDIVQKVVKVDQE